MAANPSERKNVEVAFSEVEEKRGVEVIDYENTSLHSATKSLKDDGSQDVGLPSREFHALAASHFVVPIYAVTSQPLAPAPGPQALYHSGCPSEEEEQEEGLEAADCFASPNLFSGLQSSLCASSSFYIRGSSVQAMDQGIYGQGEDPLNMSRNTSSSSDSALTEASSSNSSESNDKDSAFSGAPLQPSSTSASVSQRGNGSTSSVVNTENQFKERNMEKKLENKEGEGKDKENGGNVEGICHPSKCQTGKEKKMGKTGGANRAKTGKRESEHKHRAPLSLEDERHSSSGVYLPPYTVQGSPILLTPPHSCSPCFQDVEKGKRQLQLPGSALYRNKFSAFVSREEDMEGEKGYAKLGDGYKGRDMGSTALVAPGASFERSHRGSVPFRYLLFFIWLKAIGSYDSGAFSAVLGAADGITDEWDLDSIAQGTLTSSVFLGNVIGCPLAGQLLSLYDEQKVFGYSLLLHLIFSVSFGAFQNYYAALVNRFFIGITLAFIVVYTPVWVDEFAPRNMQSMWQALQNVGVPVGIMLGFILGSYFPTYTTLGWSYSFFFKGLLMVPTVIYLWHMDPCKFNTRQDSYAHPVIIVEDNMHLLQTTEWEDADYCYGKQEGKEEAIDSHAKGMGELQPCLEKTEGSNNGSSTLAVAVVEEKRFSGADSGGTSAGGITCSPVRVEEHHGGRSNSTDMKLRGGKEEGGREAEFHSAPRRKKGCGEKHENLVVDMVIFGEERKNRTSPSRQAQHQEVEATGCRYIEDEGEMLKRENHFLNLAKGNGSLPLKLSPTEDAYQELREGGKESLLSFSQGQPVVGSAAHSLDASQAPHLPRGFPLVGERKNGNVNRRGGRGKFDVEEGDHVEEEEEEVRHTHSAHRASSHRYPSLSLSTSFLPIPPPPTSPAPSLANHLPRPLPCSCLSLSESDHYHLHHRHHCHGHQDDGDDRGLHSSSLNPSYTRPFQETSVLGIGGVAQNELNTSPGVPCNHPGSTTTTPITRTTLRNNNHNNSSNNCQKFWSRRNLLRCIPCKIKQPFSFFLLGLYQLLTNVVYVCSTLSMCCLYFAATGLQNFVTQYLREEPFNASMQTIMIGFGGSVVTAPVLGVMLSGFMLDKIGGYSHHFIRTTLFSLFFGVLGSVSAVVCCFMATTPSFLATMSVLLFCGGAIVPPGIGLTMASLPSSRRSEGAALSQTLYNMVGNFSGPLVCGAVAQWTGELRWGIITILLSSILGVVPLLVVLAWGVCTRKRKIR